MDKEVTNITELAFLSNIETKPVVKVVKGLRDPNRTPFEEVERKMNEMIARRKAESKA
jgi:hypothetical protein